MFRFKELRMNNGETQLQISQMLGIDRTTYTKYETGVSDPPSGFIIQLASHYDVSVGYLLGTELAKRPFSKNVNCESLMELSDSEQFLIETFRGLSGQGKDYILNQMNIASQVYTKNASVPVAGTEAG